MTKHIGVVAGSFDPITNGHLWLIEQAANLVDELCIVVGHNPDKKYMFTLDERLIHVKKGIEWLDSNIRHDTVHVHAINNMMLIDYATKVEATHLIRGVRSIKDFEYELNMLSVNRDINPDIETVFFTPPAHLANVSSSTVKGLVGFDGWEKCVSKYVMPAILTALIAKRGT